MVPMYPVLLLIVEVGTMIQSKLQNKILRLKQFFFLFFHFNHKIATLQKMGIFHESYLFSSQIHIYQYYSIQAQLELVSIQKELGDLENCTRLQILCYCSFLQIHMSEEEQVKPLAKKQAIDYFSLVDFFSKQTTFGFQGEDSFRTLCGGFVSLAIMIVCLIYTVTDQSFYDNSIKQSLVVSEDKTVVNDEIIEFGLSFTKKGEKTNLDPQYWSINFYCVKYGPKNVKISQTPMGYDRNCQVGDYCLPKNSTCQLYMLRTGEYQNVEFGINMCNWTASPSTCSHSYFQTEFSAGSGYYVHFHFINIRPKPLEVDWIRLPDVRSVNMEYPNAQLNEFTVMKSKFNTNYNILGMFGIGGQTIEKFSFRRGDLAAIMYNPGFLPPGFRSFNFRIKPFDKAAIWTQVFTDVANMISYYLAISGIVLVFFTILFSHYNDNMMQISLAQHLHYITGPDHQPMNFSETNLQTVLTCAIYFDAFKRFYPKCLEPHILMIQAGRKKLNLNFMLEDLVDINAHDIGKNPVIKLKLDEELDDQEQKKQDEEEEDIEAKLEDFIRAQIGQSNISVREVSIFLKWVKINNYRLEDAKKICLRLFKNRSIGSRTEIFWENEMKQYSQFKGSIRQNDIDDLYLVVEGSPQQQDESEINLKNITIKSEKPSLLARQSLQVKQKELREFKEGL